MSRRYYEPNALIVDRAVEVWKRLLRNPKYDAVGDDVESQRANPHMAFASLLAHNCRNNAEEPGVLDKFGEALRKRLMEKDPEYHCFETHLSVDYDPCRTLHQAAEEAGLKMQWPWKTTMHLDTDNLCVGVGYGAPYEYHYPLPDGRWLITGLNGKDIDKIIDYVQGGKPEFTVEEVPQEASA